MLLPEISNVTWSSQDIRVEYSDSTIAFLSAEDLYPLAVMAKPAPLVLLQSNYLPIGAI
jgi:hypothetical protein